MATSAPVKLTQTLITKLITRSAAYDQHDTVVPGLVVRVRPSGVHTWRVRLKDTTRRHATTQRPIWYWWTLGPADVLMPDHARRLAKKVIGQVASGHDPRAARQMERANARTSITFAEFLETDYAPWATAHLKTGTDTVTRLTRNFGDVLGSTPLNRITAFAVEHWRSGRLKAGTAPATVNRDLVCLKGALTKAVEWNRLDRQPLATVKLSKVDTRGTVRYLTPPEEARLLKMLDARDAHRQRARQSANEWRDERRYTPLPKFARFTDLINPLVRTALHTGLRFGELCNLTWEDVDLGTNSTVTVQGHGAKSGHTRHVPLHDEARDVLKAWRPKQASGTAFVFPGKAGVRLTDVKTSWRQVLKAAKIMQFRFHDLRHTFASKLVQGGVDLNTVRDLLGHGDFKMTLRYSHLAPDNRRAAVARLVQA